MENKQMTVREHIDTTEFYTIHEPTYMHCDQLQFTYVCIAHREAMGCYFCEFDYNEPCDH